MIPKASCRSSDYFERPGTCSGQAGKQPPDRQRKVTLEQLIETLREAERTDKKKAERKPKNVIDMSDYHEVHDVDDILDLAHDEDIELTILRVERFLASDIPIGDRINLLTIVQMLDGRGDWVDAFLAMLFLSNAGKITLEQSEFYGPLYMVRCEDPKIRQLRLCDVGHELKSKIEAILFMTDKPVKTHAIARMINEDVQVVETSTA